MPPAGRWAGSVERIGAGVSAREGVAAHLDGGLRGCGVDEDALETTGRCRLGELKPDPAGGPGNQCALILKTVSVFQGLSSFWSSAGKNIIIGRPIERHRGRNATHGGRDWVCSAASRPAVAGITEQAAHARFVPPRKMPIQALFKQCSYFAGRNRESPAPRAVRENLDNRGSWLLLYTRSQ